VKQGDAFFIDRSPHIIIVPAEILFDFFHHDFLLAGTSSANSIDPNKKRIEPMVIRFANLSGIAVSMKHLKSDGAEGMGKRTILNFECLLLN
jgi:hypothetical protein